MLAPAVEHEGSGTGSLLMVRPRRGAGTEKNAVRTAGITPAARLKQSRCCRHNPRSFFTIRNCFFLPVELRAVTVDIIGQATMSSRFAQWSCLPRYLPALRGGTAGDVSRMTVCTDHLSPAPLLPSWPEESKENAPNLD
jgi:hypothetical protein